jgi:hypothetical protein
LALNWTLSDYRNSSSLTYVLFNFSFTVGDTTLPTIGFQPQDLSYEHGSSGNKLNWSAIDLNPGAFTVNQNGSFYDSGTWFSGVPTSVDIDGLNPGGYNFTIEFLDSSGNPLTDEVLVTVIDTGFPVITVSPGNTSYVEGSQGNTLSWIATDSNASTYTVYENNIEVDNGNWASGFSIDVNIDGLPFGEHNYTIVVRDFTGNIDVDTIFVTVTDIVFPVIEENPIDLSYDEGTTSHTLSWNVSDSYPGTYTIYYNGTPIVTHTDVSWTSFSNIILAIDGYTKGSHNFTFEVMDVSGNTVRHTVILTVVDGTDPIIAAGPEDAIRYFVGETNNLLSWEVSDTYPGNYIIYNNSIVADQGNWNSATNITINIDGLSIGEHNFTITIFDASGNSVSDIVIVTVKDPEIIETLTPDITITDQLFEGDVEVLEVLWNSLSGQIVPDGQANITLVAINVTGYNTGEAIAHSAFLAFDTSKYLLTLNYTFLNVGTYQWQITFDKEGYESTTQIIRDFVIVPRNLLIEIDVLPELTQNEEFIIIATIHYQNEGTELGLNELTSRTGVAVGINVTFIVQVTLEGGTQTTIQTQATTNSDGIATGTLLPGQTQDIETVDGISVEINNPFGNFVYITPQVPEDDLPKVKSGTSNIQDWITDRVEFIFDNIIYVIAALFLVLIVLLLVRRQIKKRRTRIRILAMESESATEEISGLLSIHAIIIKNTRSGLPFYEAIFEESLDANLDLTLISGLTTAITSFLDEVKEDVHGFESMERAGLSITSYKGQVSTIILI